jgi:phospholipid/cholesterol/gamma-HCH transport system substrate-binding protein
LVLAATAAAILLFARVGSVHGDTYHLYALTDDASGVIKGTRVWLAGRKVGLVRGIAFRSPTSDSLGRVLIKLEVLKQYQPQIRRDSRAEIRSGGRWISTPVVYIDVGTTSTPELREGDTIPHTNATPVDQDALTADVAAASRDVPEILRNMREILGGLQQKILRVDPGEIERAGQTKVLAAQARSLGQRVTAGSGTIALTIRDQSLIDRARHARARAESLVVVVSQGTGSIARMRRDTLLLRTLSDTRNELSIVRARLAEPRGSAGRLTADSALVQQLRSLERNLGSAIEDLKRDPTRYISF